MKDLYYLCTRTVVHIRTESLTVLCPRNTSKYKEGYNETYGCLLTPLPGREHLQFTVFVKGLLAGIPGVL